MPQPSDVHVNQLLTSVSVAFAQDPSKFIADVVFPRVPSDKQSNYYATFPIGSFTRSQMAKRGPGSAAMQATYEVSKDQYFCDVWNLAHKIDDQERANTDDPYAEDSATSTFLTTQELIRREQEWATAYFATGIWTGGSVTDPTGGTDFTKWDDISSDPISDIALQCEAMEGKTGFWPTDLTLTRPVWRALKNHPDIIARIAGGATPGSPAIVTRQLVAALFEIERINLSAAVVNSAGENVADSIAYILGKHALLTYRPAVAANKVPSAGYTFFWKGLVGSDDGRRILKMRDDLAHSDHVEIEATWGQKVVSASLGVFFQSAVS